MSTVVELLAQLLLRIVAPLLRGDTGVLEKRVDELLPRRLQITMAKAAAEERRAKRNAGGS